MTFEEFRALLIVDNALHDGRVTLFVRGIYGDRAHISMFPMEVDSDLSDDHEWAYIEDDEAFEWLAIIFPSMEDFSSRVWNAEPLIGAKIELHRWDFALSGNDLVLLRLMEHGTTPPCETCGGHGWVSTGGLDEPCDDCGNPFLFSKKCTMHDA